MFFVSRLLQGDVVAGELTLGEAVDAKVEKRRIGVQMRQYGIIKHLVDWLISTNQQGCTIPVRCSP